MLATVQAKTHWAGPMRHIVFDLLNELDAGRIHYVLSRHQPGSIMITVTLVGERVEVVVFEDEQVHMSRFRGTEAVEGGADLLKQLIRESRE